MTAPSSWGLRPEHAAGCGSEYYNDNEAQRYTSTLTTNIIQTELTIKSLRLLGIQEREFHLIVDIGCGSGLSGRVLTSEKLPWVGTDISLPMLNLAAAQEPGLCCLNDIAQGLPLRSAAFDFAISISAVQWLCVHQYPRQAAALFFENVWRCLKPNGRAAFQIYIESDSQMELLVTAARTCGFVATYCVDFPHPTPAKKYYLLLAKEAEQSGGADLGVNIETNRHMTEKTNANFDRCCNLAWPATAACSLSWLKWLEERNPELGACAQNCSIRSWQEHTNLGRRLVRLLRHACNADREQFGDPPWPVKVEQSSGKSSTGSGDQIVEYCLSAVVCDVELALRQLDLMPCGGSVIVHFHSLADNSAIDLKTSALEAIAGAPLDLHDASAANYAQILSEKSLTRAYNPPSGENGAIAPLTWHDYFLKAAKSDALLAKANSNSKKHFYLERVGSTCSGGGCVGILHATKPAMSQVLVLPSTHRHHCPTESTATASIEATQEKKEGWQGLEKVKLKLAALCKEYNACVVGVDAVVNQLERTETHNGGRSVTDNTANEAVLSCAWVVYVPKLDTLDRDVVQRVWKSQLTGLY